MVTDFGRLMDPIADKILVLAAFLAFVQMQLVNSVMVMIIIFRELLITYLRLFALNKGRVLSAGRAGKHKTLSQMLVIFFILGLMPLFGLGINALQRFETLSIILGAEFGSIISLGIGPIVTASIVLQLLNGSGIWKFDLTNAEGKKSFQGTQKFLSLFFIVFESSI